MIKVGALCEIVSGAQIVSSITGLPLRRPVICTVDHVAGWCFNDDCGHVCWIRFADGAVACVDDWSCLRAIDAPGEAQRVERAVTA